MEGWDYLGIVALWHCGIVAGVCQEIGLLGYLDALAGPCTQQVSVGTAMVAMILNGLELS